MSDGRDPRAAGGFASVVSAAQHVARKAGLVRGASLLLRMNQQDGFDCPGCAWPDPERRGALEFCENGAKHLAHEATSKRVTAAWMAEWPIPRLAAQPDHWLEAQGRIAEPLWKPPGEERYRAITWDEAFGRIGAELRDLSSPDEAIFYTSGRTSNEAAFLYQLFVREYGTNNLPDCSNLCHESSGFALSETIGSGKGTVGLHDFGLADAILLIGQNPGTNHPRMMTTLQEARRRGCKIISVNPLRERALVRFAHPQNPLELLGASTPISDLFLQVRVGGDVALLKGIQKEVLALEDERPGQVVDWDFLRAHSVGFDAWRAALADEAWDELTLGSGIPRAQMREAAELYCAAERVIACWAMGITQHRHGVANVQEIVNLLLLRGNLGRPGAGVCPVRGHSNVQGDRTMGIWERPKQAFLDALESEFDFTAPRAHGLDSVGAIRAMADGEAKVFFGLGGNFVVATPDTAYTEAALRRCRMTVQVSTTLNRSHLVVGDEAIVLPCLARSELDVQSAGPQFVTVEDSTSVIGRSRGVRTPASPALRSEVAIVAGLARATLGARSRVPWEALSADYDEIRERIARVVPGFARMNQRVREPGGFVLESGARTRHFETASGRAHFTVTRTPALPSGDRRLLLTTIRSHDQFNTTVYGLDDRYRGIYGDRRVVLVHADDLRALGLAEGERVDVTSHFEGVARTLRGFRCVAYDVPRGCAAAYYPEANPLVPVDAFAEGSRTPSYKSIEVSLTPAREASAPGARS